VQSFGDFNLEELDNDASLVFLILTFLILNIMLMNLLIAMMASTYEKVWLTIDTEMGGRMRRNTATQRDGGREGGVILARRTKHPIR